jgi:hypothetical protein
MSEQSAEVAAAKSRVARRDRARAEAAERGRALPEGFRRNLARQFHEAGVEASEIVRANMAIAGVLPGSSNDRD